MLELETQIRDSLADLFPGLEDSPADWDAIREEAHRKRRYRLASRGRRGRVLIFAVVAMLTVGTAGAAVAYHLLSGASLTPANISALTDPRTALPADTRVYGGAPDEGPSPGPAHLVGNGAAAVWMHHNELCWSTVPLRGGRGVSSCGDLRPGVPIPFTPIVHVDGTLDSGPVHVFGLAVDAVRDVVVKLTDGTTYSSVPAENWFDVTLPAGDFSRVATVTAMLDDGSTYSVPINNPTPTAPVSGGSSG